MVVVQDILDCLRVSQSGCRAVVALLGPGMSEIQKIELVTRFHAIMLMFRGDETGWALSQNCVSRLVTQISVHAAVLPSGPVFAVWLGCLAPALPVDDNGCRQRYTSTAVFP